MFSKQKSNLGIPSAMLFNQSILDVFVLQGILELEDAEKLKKNFKTNREIENFLLKNHLVTRDTINKAYSIILKLPFIELSSIKIEQEVLDVIPEKIALRLGIIPFDLDGMLLKVAITLPSDLPIGFTASISKLLKNKKANLELFITGTNDFKEAVKQYKIKPKKSLLIKKGSLPIVYLRNRKISRHCLNKIPKSFIEKYRLLVFDENIAGNYLVACEKPDSPLTKKIFKYIEKENKVKLEIFATSGSDIDYVLENYDSETPFQIEELQIVKKEEKKPEKKEQFKVITQDSINTAISSIQKRFFKPKTPTLTIDSIVKRPEQFQKDDKNGIIINEGKSDEPSAKSINLIGKIPKSYLAKLPKEFIEKYRVVVFGENDEGDLMLASDTLGAEVTKKAISFIKNQHPVEVFSTKSADIEYALSIYE